MTPNDLDRKDHNPVLTAALNQRIPKTKQQNPAPGTTEECDPNGLDQHSAGAKCDAGKVRAALVMASFARAIWEVCRVGTFGAEKYTPRGWETVDKGEERYDDAMMRHWLKQAMGQELDDDLPVEHLAQVAWNALARLELKLRRQLDPESLAENA